MGGDRELLKAWQEGDVDAGSALFQRHFDGIYRFFQRRAPADVSDLVQRTFLACVEARDRYRQSASFRSFLYGIARMELRIYFRKRRDDVDFGVSSIADLTQTPSSLVRAQDDVDRLHAALSAIPADLQMALELHYWEELTGPELAEVLEIPEGTVRSRLRRAKKKLLEQLQALGAPAGELGRMSHDFEGQLRQQHRP